jgi:beta-glucanase (GH16 family)
MNYTLIILSLLLSICNSPAQNNTQQLNSGFVPENYVLTWHDEFESTVKSGVPDTVNWYYNIGNHGWGNNELQNYIPGIIGSDTCALVSNGTLKIIAKKKDNQVISARLNTKDSWKYGYFEARLKLPKGKGTWPAFWMLSENQKEWPLDGEIDIMEEVGYRPNYVVASIHCKAYNHVAGSQKNNEIFVATAESDFHVYAVDWTEDYIRAYVDGKEYFEFMNDKKGDKLTWPFDVPFYLKLNLAWGGFWGGAEGVDEKVLPAVYEVDYVRVYQKK